MSLSNRTESQPNPAQRFFEWSAVDGKIKWYNKETKENEYVKLPFKFLVLDILSTVKGYSDADESGLWSNEIRDTRTDVLTVRSKRGVKSQGLYADVKNVQGARFTQSVYIAFKDDDGELAIGNFQMHGVTNSAFIEFRKLHRDVYGKTISVTGSIDGKKGATKFKIPVFEISEASSETIAEAMNLDRELQAYLKGYLVRTHEAVPAEDEIDDNYTGVNLDAEPPEQTGYIDDPDADYPF